MYINILKILRRPAVNITCFKPRHFGISALVSSWNPLPSLLSLVVTLAPPEHLGEMLHTADPHGAASLPEAGAPLLLPFLSLWASPQPPSV